MREVLFSTHDVLSMGTSSTNTRFVSTNISFHIYISPAYETAFIFIYKVKCLAYVWIIFKKKYSILSQYYGIICKRRGWRESTGSIFFLLAPQKTCWEPLSSLNMKNATRNISSVKQKQTQFCRRQVVPIQLLPTHAEHFPSHLKLKALFHVDRKKSAALFFLTRKLKPICTSRSTENSNMIWMMLKKGLK